MNERYRIPMNGPAGRGENIIKGDCYRFTVLTPSMIRLEYNKKGIFVDEPTQTVWFRSFPAVSFQWVESDESLRIETDNLILYYIKEEFSKDSLYIKVKKNERELITTWQYGEPLPTLKGTVRTLDNVDGAVTLEEGLLSRNGAALFDDSNSCLIKEDGELCQREYPGIDLYFLGYGHEYLTCLRDFYQLTGKTPLLPRYAFGNWWSKFHRYTEKEYKCLIEKFEKEEIPLSVAVIDMDWHITEVEKEYGTGWTGYTWNYSLFPDPERFIKWLHKKGLKVALNVHPADGVRAYEEPYPDMAKALGMDVSKKRTIEFDCTNSKFMEAYFEYLHHPNEKKGVDFWWVDWQQGMTSKLPGLDPLWCLNHYHYLDNGRNNKRPLILSRYAGFGSHRYPVGFSGDSIISWASFRFQPYFTATASNVGFCWWSHDIGGHMLGTYDEELQIRWTQFGVFSPILRLHSSGSIFNHKEPWNYSPETNRIMKIYLRLRHQLIPYLYSMNYKTYKQGRPLICPLYYEYPETDTAYEMPNEYFFGTEMICLPITRPLNKVIQGSKVKGFIPEGTYIDWMTGLIYKGSRIMDFYRSLEQIPVLIKAGGIIPCAVLREPMAATQNPDWLELTVCAGGDGEFTLYEDDGITMDYEKGEFVTTKFELDYQQEKELIIRRPEGNLHLIPKMRSYRIKFLGFTDPGRIFVSKNGIAKEIKYQYNRLRNEIVIEKIPIGPEDELRVQFDMKLGCNYLLSRCFELLDRAQIAFKLKEKIFQLIKAKLEMCASDENLSILEKNISEKRTSEKMVMELIFSLEFLKETNEDLYGELYEILLAKSDWEDIND